MKRLLAVGLSVLVCTSFVRADVWCGVKRYPGEVNLNRSAIAAFKGGNSLYELCSGEDGSFDSFQCLGYVTGVADVLAAQSTNGVCLPKNVSTIQLVDVVRKYLKEHPETRQYTGASEVEAALDLAFPCSMPSHSDEPPAGALVQPNN